MDGKLNIVYVTSRKEPRFEWFSDSLRRELKGVYENVKLIVVSHQLWYDQKPEYFLGKLWNPLVVVIAPPKPTVWAGPHRLTSVDWFSASSTRNTGLCLCDDGYVVFCDDLSILLPGWLDRVKAAMAGNYIVCGTYRKVNKMVVENGELISFADHHAGNDSRARFATSDLHPCEGGWLFGCSCAMPVEALLTIGGWTEFADGLGSEDYLTGLTLQNAGFKFFYDKKMMTFESEELHHAEPGLGRTDKGKSPDDKSHRALNIVLSGQKYFDNYYAGGIRAERERVLQGEPFTIRQIPDRDWYDGQLVSEMTPVPK
jgi:hypothetical protein